MLESSEISHSFILRLSGSGDMNTVVMSYKVTDVVKYQGHPRDIHNYQSLSLARDCIIKKMMSCIQNLVPMGV